MGAHYGEPKHAHSKRRLPLVTASAGGGRVEALDVSRMILQRLMPKCQEIPRLDPAIRRPQGCRVQSGSERQAIHNVDFACVGGQ
eukprot:4252058-Prymnesium_polylepis.1